VISISPRDAIHVATMESAGIRRILTIDRDFDVIEEVIRVDPTELAS
jgi:predicted nucleic acid-binding protein